MYSVFFLHVCSGCCATMYLCTPSQETCLSSVATSRALLAEGEQAVIPLLTPYLLCKCMGGNILLHLRTGARKSAFLLQINNHKRPNNFPPPFPGIQNTYRNPELLQIFFSEKYIVTKIFLMARMAAGLVFFVVLFF